MVVTTTTVAIIITTATIKIIVIIKEPRLEFTLEGKLAVKAIIALIKALPMKFAITSLATALEV